MTYVAKSWGPGEELRVGGVWLYGRRLAPATCTTSSATSRTITSRRFILVTPRSANRRRLRETRPRAASTSRLVPPAETQCLAGATDGKGLKRSDSRCAAPLVPVPGRSDPRALTPSESWRDQ